MRCNAVVYFARGGHFYLNTGVNTAKECIGIKFVKRSEREAKANREGGVFLNYFILFRILEIGFQKMARRDF